MNHYYKDDPFPNWHETMIRLEELVEQGSCLTEFAIALDHKAGQEAPMRKRPFRIAKKIAKREGFYCYPPAWWRHQRPKRRWE